MDRRRAVVIVAAIAFTPFTAAQPSRRAVVGFFRNTSAAESRFLVDALRASLAEAGFVDKKNIEFEYRFADGRQERMPALAVELVKRRVDVLFAGGTAAAVAAKAATSTIPIVAALGEDPKKLGMVDSLARPGGNITGVAFLTLSGKRLEFFHMLVPKAKTIGYLVNPGDLQTSTLQSEDAQATAHALGVKLMVFKAKNEQEIEEAFTTFAQQRLRAVHVGGSALFLSKRKQIVSLATSHSMATSFQNREGAEAGALLSYGASVTDAYRQAGLYVARILKGAKPGDLPIIQASTPELLVNLRTAKALGIALPQSVLQRADGVIQ